MKKTALAALAAVVLAGACTDSNIVAPGTPEMELVDGYGTTVSNANVDVYGSFSVSFGGGTVDVLDYVGPGYNEEEQAIGSCANGKWSNPGRSNKQTGPLIHQHCVRGAALASSPSMVVTLEGISGHRGTSGPHVTQLLLEDSEALKIHYNSSSDRNNGTGLLVAYGTSGGIRTGMFVVDLDDFDTGTGSGNLLNGRCYIGELDEGRAEDTENWINCLAPTNSDGEIVADSNGNYSGKITANFFHDIGADPTTDDPDAVVQGYLWWVSR
jgi:hypothetical protein